MKKYRPYKEFPDDIVGKVVKTKSGENYLVIRKSSGGSYIDVLYAQYSKTGAFEQLTFLDGTPVGEEYEEKVELEHDKVYLVRNSRRDVWIPRFFGIYDGGRCLFYCDGRSSQTLSNNYGYETNAWVYVCEYDESIKGTTKEPSNYLVKPE